MMVGICMHCVRCFDVVLWGFHGVCGVANDAIVIMIPDVVGDCCDYMVFVDESVKNVVGEIFGQNEFCVDKLDIRRM